MGDVMTAELLWRLADGCETLPSARRQGGTKSMQADRPAPTDASERHHILDALRGWALAGVLMANMVMFIGFGLSTPEQRTAALGSALDDISELLIEWLVVGKFYSLFSLLFGIGFALQLGRLEHRRRPLGGHAPAGRGEAVVAAGEDHLAALRAIPASQVTAPTNAEPRISRPTARC